MVDSVFANLEGIEPGWFYVPRVKEPRNDSLYEDVYCHLPPNVKPFRDSDPCTAVHETLHGFHAELRMKLHGWNAFYCLRGRGFRVPEPGFRKSQIARYVRKRGPNFNLYVSGQPAWDSQPLYLLDEWVAYAGGTECWLDAAKAGLCLGRPHDTAANALEFSEYARALQEAQRALDPNYPHAEILDQFIEEHTARVQRLFEEASGYKEIPLLNSVMEYVRTE